MLEPRDIAAWSAHAPWALESQIEQDLLITRAVMAIFSDPFLSTQVAMRGGTVLHKIHLAPAARYSEDIDLVAVGDRPRGHIVQALRRVLKPLLGAPVAAVWTTIRLAIRNAARPSEVAVLKYEYETNSGRPPVMTLKVEVNVTERTPFYDLLRIPFTAPLPEGSQTATVVSYDLNEMLGTKMRALLQREQGRDLFDLAHACAHAAPFASGHALSGPKVAAAFAKYMADEGATVSRHQFTARLDN